MADEIIGINIQSIFSSHELHCTHRRLPRHETLLRYECALRPDPDEALLRQAKQHHIYILLRVLNLSSFFLPPNWIFFCLSLYNEKFDGASVSFWEKFAEFGDIFSIGGGGSGAAGDSRAAGGAGRHGLGVIRKMLAEGATDSGQATITDKLWKNLEFYRNSPWFSSIFLHPLAVLRYFRVIFVFLTVKNVNF